MKLKSTPNTILAKATVHSLLVLPAVLLFVSAVQPDYLSRAAANSGPFGPFGVGLAYGFVILALVPGLFVVGLVLSILINVLAKPKVSFGNLILTSAATAIFQAILVPSALWALGLMGIQGELPMQLTAGITATCVAFVVYGLLLDEYRSVRRGARTLPASQSRHR